MDSTQKHGAIAEAIFGYCAIHPRAADTLEGVRGWLPAELQSVLRSELEAALGSLVRAGTLTQRPLADGSVVYFCSPPTPGNPERVNP
ncbi:MAG TPA: hypothetical protein VGK73_17805 [Polyangiaceae bacterium]